MKKSRGNYWQELWSNCSILIRVPNSRWGMSKKLGFGYQSMSTSQNPDFGSHKKYGEWHVFGNWHRFQFLAMPYFCESLEYKKISPKVGEITLKCTVKV